LKGGFNLFFCGATVERYGPDYLQTSISMDSLEFPRTLVEGGTVNGVVQQRVTCGDPWDCLTKCERFSRTAREGGLEAPEACTLCDSICPSNLITTVAEATNGLRIDVGNAVRLIDKCFAGTRESPRTSALSRVC
jgi:hypothetical protein